MSAAPKSALPPASSWFPVIRLTPSAVGSSSTCASSRDQTLITQAIGAESNERAEIAVGDCRVRGAEDGNRTAKSQVPRAVSRTVAHEIASGPLAHHDTTRRRGQRWQV